MKEGMFLHQHQNCDDDFGLTSPNEIKNFLTKNGVITPYGL